jgi:hypothetical protein
MKGISYSEYLFSNLLKLYDKKFETMEYDRQFDMISKEYENFTNSKFDRDTEPLYACIIAYLKDKYGDREAEFTSQDLDEDNTKDLLKWVGNDELWGLIDEEQGGIIGYIHHSHMERITNLLNNYK